MWVGVLIVLGGLWFDRLCVRVALGCLIGCFLGFLLYCFLVGVWLVGLVLVGWGCVDYWRNLGMFGFELIAC